MRQLSRPLFLEDVEAQRSRVNSARSQRSDACCSSPRSMSGQVPHPTGKETEAPEWIPMMYKAEDPFDAARNDDAEAAPATVTLTAMTILKKLRGQTACLRRPSHVPTPPPPPVLEDLIGGGRRRVSLFPQRIDRTESEDTQEEKAETPIRQESENFGVDLADARTGFHEDQLRFSFEDPDASSSTPTTSGPARAMRRDMLSNTREYDAGSSLSPDQARRRAFFAKMNDVIAINTGVHLMIPYFPVMPHYQSLHPLDLAREVSKTELPYSLRVGYASSGSEDAAVPQNRGFITVAQWRREGRSSNFVMPSVSNPGPVVSGVGVVAPSVKVTARAHS
jgi:hypothetical protein